MAKILVITPQIPFPPEQGTSLRNYYILRGLSINNEVTLISFDENDGKQEIPAELNFCKDIRIIPVVDRTLLDRVADLIFSRQPDLTRRLRSELLELQITDVLSSNDQSNREPIDIVQIEGLELGHSLSIAKAALPAVKIVFDNHNAESELQRKAYFADRSNPVRWHAALYSLIQSRRLRTYELGICRLADWVTFVSEQDRSLVQGSNPKSNSTVIPNFLDTKEYAFSEEDDSYPYDLLFIGKMDYRPNVDAVLWFANEIWPELRKARPNISWAIVGKNPHPRLKSISETEGIHLTGRVKSIQPYLKGAKVVVLPFRVGSGTRLKFIEALAAGKAVVSTRVGVEGFDVVDKHDLLIADQPSKFVDSVITLLENADLRSRLGQNGREKAVKYDWRVVVPLFDQVYESLLMEHAS